MENIYENNLSILEKINSELYKDLKKINSNNRFEVFQGDHEKAINIKDTQTKEFFYENPVAEFELQKKKFKKYIEYDYLYIFGIGNGLFLKELLKNNKHLRIVIVEPELEVLYIALNLNSYTKELTEHRLVLLTANRVNFNLAVHLFAYKTAKIYAKVYTILPICQFYEKNYSSIMENINSIYTKAITYMITLSGNDIIDAIIGMKHHLENTQIMLKNPKFSELKTKKNTDIAIIVSTGPSLYKQLKKLKKIQKHVTIISVDASLPILEKHDIKPDIVTSIERVPLTATFFENTSKEFQKDIIFLSASLQHKKVLNAIKGTKVLVMRPFTSNFYFELNEYGYLGMGMSAANLAHELAIEMSYQTIVLIGQDLAYAKSGKSHSKGHVLGEDDVKALDTDIELPAYGGKGTVKSTKIWSIFRDTFIQIIQKNSHKNLTINATEGGCYISDAKEMSFDEVISKLVDQKNQKSKITLTYPKKEIYEKLIIKADKKLQQLIQSGEILQKQLEKSFLKIQKECKILENISLDKAFQSFSQEKTTQLIQEIENIRNKVESNIEFRDFYYEISQSCVLNYELELAVIKTRYVQNPIDNQKKALEWILEHRYWLFTLAGNIKNILDILKTSKNEWDI